MKSIYAPGARLLTKGLIWKNILWFAVPLMAGNFFQQLYNTVDTIVVGNYVGPLALAAVGTVDPVINAFIGCFMGLSTGAGVVVSQYYGARDAERVGKAVHTTIVLTALLCTVCTSVALWTIPAMLRWMHIPDEVYPLSESYLTIYFSGMSALLLYNMGSGILRAVGDSVRPVWFLIFSTIANIVLDLVFVAWFGWGVEGAAWATVAAQTLSAVLVLAVLAREKGMYRISARRLALDVPIARRIVHIGLPTAFQLMIIAFSNVFVQAYINFFGAAAMAGWSAYMKVDKVCLLPIHSISMAVTTFMGQNIGAGEMQRARACPGTAVRMSVFISVCIILPIVVWAPQLATMFGTDVGMLEYATLYMRLMMPFFVVVCFQSVYISALQGAGCTRVPMCVSIFSFIIFRQIYLYCISGSYNLAHWIALGYPFGWIVCSTIIVLYYRRVDLSKYKITRK